MIFTVINLDYFSGSNFEKSFFNVVNGAFAVLPQRV
jgi:hypothetical protein